jgi:glyoxylate reductase
MSQTPSDHNRSGLDVGADLRSGYVPRGDPVEAKPKVLVTHPLIEGGLALLEEHYAVEVADGLGPEQLRDAISGVDALIPLLSVRVDAGVLEGADRLKVIANYAVGFDNIDLAAATARKIWVTNTPGVLTEATADLTWSALLALVRRVVEGDALVRAGQFNGWGPTLLLGTDLSGKTLGIAGLGKIGRAVARRAAGFGMRVIYNDSACSGPIDLGLLTAECVGLEELLREADVVSVHTPLTPQTRHLLDRRRLALMKPTAYLVNTARGPVVEEQALVELLQERRLAGAALDVYEHEPALTPGLAELDNVVLLPHLGSATRETRLTMARLAAENAHAVLQGRRPPNPVNNI